MNQVPLLLILTIGLCGAEYTHYKLPSSFKPLTYNLKVLTHLQENGDKNVGFEGEVSIKLVALDKASNVTLHVKDLFIDETSTKLLNQNTSKLIKILNTSKVDKYNYYILNLDGNVQPNEHYELKLVFKGDFNDNDEGYFRKNYTDSNFMSITQLEPCFARQAFPCFDEPELKATFTITLGYHKRFQSNSNMPVAHQRPHETLQDYVWCEFQESVQMPTYLVVYSVHELKEKVSTTTPDNVQVTTWPHPASPNTNDAAYVNDLVARALSFFGKLFRLYFPLPKLDQISVPGAQIDIKNWGLISFPSLNVSNFSELTLEINNELLITVIQRICNQWFGNLVTIKWWPDLWLNNAFASYMGSFVMEQLEPKLEPSKIKTFESLISAFLSDDKPSSPAVSQDLAQPDEIKNSFDPTTCKKGSLLLRMLHQFIGHDTFFDGLRGFLVKHSYGNAGTKDLWKAFGNSTTQQGTLSSKYSLATIMNSWISQPGYPIINVDRDCKTGSVSITQKRFLRHNETDSNPGCWWIPLTYATAANPNFTNTIPKHWFECDKSVAANKPKVMNLNLDNSHWIIFNLQMSGFFRINYDMQNWRLLINKLNSDSYQDIHVMNRAQLLNDVLMLVRYGSLHKNIAMNLLKYLRRETEYEPWMMALKGIEVLESFYEKTPSQPYFVKYMLTILMPAFNFFRGLEDNFGRLLTSQKILKAEIAKAACYYGHDTCHKQTFNWIDKLRAINVNAKNPLPIQLRAIIYCNFIRNQKSNDDWQLLFDRFRNTKDSQDKKFLQYGLSCSTNESQLAQVMDPILDNLMVPDSINAEVHGSVNFGFGFDLDIETKKKTVTNIAEHKVGLNLLFKLLFSKFGAVPERASRQPGLFSMLINAVAPCIKTSADMVRLQSIFDINKISLANTNLWKLVKKSYSIMKANVKWHVSKKEDIFDVFKEWMDF